MNFKKCWQILTSSLCKKPTNVPDIKVDLNPNQFNKKNSDLFDISYFMENIKEDLTEPQANNLLLNTTMNDPYYKEKIAVLFYNKSLVKDKETLVLQDGVVTTSMNYNIL